MSLPPGVGAGTDGRAGEIRLQGLVKSFKGPHGPIEAVRGVEIEIAAGETVALLGPNGAGKSTTIDMLLGLVEPDTGSVSVFGRSPSDAVAAGAVGAILQTGSLIRDLTVREPRGARRALLAGQGMARDGGVDGAAERARDPRLPARHGAGLSAGAGRPGARHARGPRH
jgi:ABC-type sugar transport system ATPase subunit